ncbi:MAG: 50S ribosomal protein L32 [Candidatus Sericytochromatia bacterium]|nr:50S ribosomal protein L32 [Candidatus Sericytochromatia bacterium]
MAQPKKKTSNSKQWSRRAHWKAKVTNLATCSNCSAKVIPHTVCAACGYYKGEQILKVVQA